MNKYELMSIVNSHLTAEEKETIYKQATECVIKGGGKIINAQNAVAFRNKAERQVRTYEPRHSRNQDIFWVHSPEKKKLNGKSGCLPILIEGFYGIERKAG